MATVPMLFLIGLLALLCLLQAHHPGESREVDRALAVVASAQGLVLLVLAIGQLVALARP